jgi:hypothetical protein
MPQPDKGLWPHLPSSSRPERGALRPQLAEALYPSLAPQPQPQPAPRPQRTPEEIFDWSNIDPRYARACGLIPTNKS